MDDSKLKAGKKVKFILVGESKVGKTSLINQYINKSFSLDHITTTGTDKFYNIVKVKDKEIKLEIWDTAGQEEYRAVNKIFMKNTQLALIVYSITDQNSFEQLSYWIKQVKEINKEKEIIFGIAANKSDLFEEQKVETEIGKKFADDNNCLFFETSAKDYKSIENVFIKIAEAYNEKLENDEKKIVDDGKGLPIKKDEQQQNNIVLDNTKHVETKNKKKGCCGGKNKKENKLDNNDINQNNNQENEEKKQNA